MLEPQIWYDYALFDNDGVCGIKEDAPEPIKKAYEDYVKEKQEAQKESIKLQKGILQNRQGAFLVPKIKQ